MKKILIGLALLFCLGASAQMSIFGQPLKVDLSNGDVRKLVIQIWTKRGYKLRSFYYTREGKAVLVFDYKGRNIKKFTSK